MNSSPSPRQAGDPQTFANSLEKVCYLGHLDGPCPYLDGYTANHLFLDGHAVGDAYRVLLDAGYRRHGCVLYRTDCGSCHQCQVIRVPVTAFRPNRSQRRAWRDGEHMFEVSLSSPVYTPEKAELYHRYLQYKHGYDGAPADRGRYTDFFVNTFLGEHTVELQLRSEGRLAGVGILDRVRNVLSAVYFFYAPEFARYSPGVYAILKEIDLAASWNLDYYYPGYYIQDCAAMRYKMNYRPCQIKEPADHIWRDYP